MSDPTETPPTPEAAKAIRGEITKVDEQAKLLRLALEHLTDEVAKSTHESKLAKQETIKLAESVSDIPGLVRRLHEIESDRIIGTIAADRAKDRKSLVELVAQERVERDKAIAASERRSDAKIGAVVSSVAALESRVDEIDLKVGVHVGDNERAHEEVTGVTNVLVKRVDEHEGFISKNKTTIAATTGSTGITLAVVHLAPLIWGAIKAYAVSKGWTK